MPVTGSKQVEKGQENGEIGSTAGKSGAVSGGKITGEKEEKTHGKHMEKRGFNEHKLNNIF